MYNSWPKEPWYQYSMSPVYSPQYPRVGMRKHSKSMSGGGGGGGSGGSCRLLVTNIPSHVRLDDFESFVRDYGNVTSCEKASSKDPNSQSLFVSYDSHEQAQIGMNELNGMSYEGNLLKAELGSEKKGKGGRSGGRGGGPPQGYAMGGGSIRQTDFPLRILVQSDMVGAIIGRQGSTIRQITQQSRARVDVHRKDNVGSLEKAITIYGNPDNCTNACKRILEVMKQEAQTNNKGEITLKILAHNNLIGRIIGKAGNTIKRIMQDTDTKITVSSINDINSFNLERIITVKGNIDSMSKAESMISAKLRQSYENDLQAMAPQSMMFPGLHPMAMMATSGIGYRNTYQGGLYSTAFPPMYQPTAPPHAPDVQIRNSLYGSYKKGSFTETLSDPNAQQETTCLYIPNNAVGAIIGTKGSHIRNMIRFSGASVKIAPVEGDKSDRDNQPQERKVTIVGSPESQWKAQYLIFEKMRDEGFVSGSEDVRLTVEILVPSSQVGRIIGKGGQNVRELQRVTGSVIKLPEQGSSPQSQEEETTVHIVGPFFSVQSAQRRIRSMVMAPSGGARSGRSGGQSSGQGSGPANQSQSQTSASQS